MNHLLYMCFYHVLRIWKAKRCYGRLQIFGIPSDTMEGGMLDILNCIMLDMFSLNGPRYYKISDMFNTILLLLTKCFACTFCQVAVNPEFKVAEMSFDNNAAICELIYGESSAWVGNCSLARP